MMWDALILQTTLIRVLKLYKMMITAMELLLPLFHIGA